MACAGYNITTRSCILIQDPNDENKATIIQWPQSNTASDSSESTFELWPLCCTSKKIYTESSTGDVIFYDLILFVKKNVSQREHSWNSVATSAAHPSNEFTANLIYGPAVIVSVDDSRRDLTMDDWKCICTGVHYNQQWIKKTIDTGTKLDENQGHIGASMDD